MKPVRISVLILCACFVSVAWGEQPTCKVYTPWAEFHRLNMERWNPCEKVLTVHNVGNLSLKWSNTFAGAVWSSPAVADGVVYVGSSDGNVWALRAKTGAKLWNYGTRSFVDSSPAVANGVVYVGANERGVYAFGLK
jgi:outer membrane protein assembly factor BamB